MSHPDSKPDVQHYHCTDYEGAGSPSFLPTGVLSRDAKPHPTGDEADPFMEDETEIYKCEGCPATIGLELGNDGKWVVYI
jgi:hypothetical protein